MNKNSKMGEFSLIENYFKQKTIARSDVVMGIGDDGALLKAPKEQLLVFSMDSLVEGVHFLPKINAYDIGFKSLAVNLSDLAAMGAEPAWLTLALTMPSIDINWINGFTEGLFFLANQFNMQLIGGDTTRGSLTITIQAHGFVPPQQALCRQGAKAGDKIYVSGTLGDAGLGLKAALGTFVLPEEAHQYVLQRLHRPIPQIKLGMLLRGLASSAIDISDGLLADLGHILEASCVGAEIWTEQIPLSRVLKEHCTQNETMKLALTAGDDYELCFTVPPQEESKLVARLKEEQISCCCIGEIKESLGMHLLGYSGSLSEYGFQHFV
ncbi:MAG: thiamine-phosphate kinase [Gammaproteobacteria bacterium]